MMDRILKIFSFLSSIWGSMIALRFIQSYTDKAIYQINTIDLIWDWSLLFFFSIITFIGLTIKFIIEIMEKEDEEMF